MSADNQRTITIVGKYTHADTDAGYKSEYQRAIGYLSTWSMESDKYPTVNIYCNVHTAELAVVYLKADGIQGYVIGGIWRGGKYELHS